MRTRIRCPFHNERTASLVRRKSDWFCYGICNKSYSQEEVEKASGQPVSFEIDESEYKEDLDEKFKYIESLGRIKIRGLEFPADQGGYYVCWPGRTYYKYRLFEPGPRGKYLSPKGHKPALFWAKKEGKNSLYITEGEISSLSMAIAFPESDHCSPGSASNFNSNYLSQYLTQFQKYGNIIVVLDDDAAGTKGLIEAKAYFLYKIPFISFIQIKPDPNDVLNEEGATALRQKVSRSNFK